MQYKMVIRQTMFDFDMSEQGKVKLRSVHFLNDSNVKKQNNLLLVTQNDAVQFFLDRRTPLSRLSREQFKFINAAAKYFGYMRDQEQLPVWVWAGSLKLPNNYPTRLQGENPRQTEPA